MQNNDVKRTALLVIRLDEKGGVAGIHPSPALIKLLDATTEISALTALVVGDSGKDVPKTPSCHPIWPGGNNVLVGQEKAHLAAMCQLDGWTTFDDLELVSTLTMKKGTEAFAAARVFGTTGTATSSSSTASAAPVVTAPVVKTSRAIKE